MAKKQSEELVLTSWKPTNVDKIDTVTMQLASIKSVTNDDELAKAESIIKLSDAVFKTVESERKMITSKLDLFKKEAMTFENKVKDALNTPKQLVTNYVRDKEQKRLAKEREIQEEADRKAASIKKEADQKQAVIDFELNTKKSIAGATGLREMNAIVKKLEEYVPTENTFGVGLKEANQMKKELLKLAIKQQEAFRGNGEKLDIDIESVEKKSEDNLSNSVQQMQNVDLESQARTQSLGSTTGIKKNWTFELVNIDDVPREYLTLDQEKVKAMIKAGVREIKGLKIFQDITRSGR